jgi:hypothetical protein
MPRLDLEILDDRTAPSLGSPVVPVVLGASLAATTPPAIVPYPVTLPPGTQSLTLDAGALFAGNPALQKDGFRVAILGNSNSGVVDLSLSDLALQLTRGQSGQATITLCATDKDGVSAKVALLVTVEVVSEDSSSS